MNTQLNRTNACCRSRSILRIVSIIALAALLSVDCRAVAAQDKPSGKPQNATDARKTSPSNSDDPQSTENRVKQILALKDRLLQLSEGDQNEKTKAEIVGLIEAITRAGASAQTWQATENTPEQRAQAQQIQQMKEMLAERERQMATLAKQMAELNRQQQALPPLENGQLKVFSLVAVPSRAAAQTIESLFGSQVLRIAVDERTNSLIVYGKSDALTAVEALLGRLDVQSASTTGGEKTKQSAAAAPRSLLLRVFWLADNLPEGVGQTPTDFLPNSVIQAAMKLGLEAPRLVTQTVNSLALSREDAVDFSAKVPAMLFDRSVELSCQGRIKLVSDDRVRLDMGVFVGGQAINCELNGSLATPLGHYMVLGTANSVMAEGGPAAGETGRGPGMMGPGTGPEGGGFRGRPGPPIGSRVYPNQVPGGFGGAEGAPAGVAPGAEAGLPGAGEQRPKQNFNTSRFAFVVQVIDGQSYPAEKDKSGSK